MHPFYDLQGKVALVTGGGGDIGGASAMALARAGADIIIVDLRREPAEERANAIRALGRRSHVLIGDCADDASVQAMAAEALAVFDRVDILVNVAGGGDPRWFWELQRPDFDQIVSRNLGSAWSWSHALFPKMQENGWGRIVNISSISAKHGGGPPATVSKSAYAAAKAGVIGLTKGLAKELSPQITVNAICPGLIHARGTKRIIEAPGIDEILKTIPKGRVGRPDDVAAAVLFFASPGADWITGETMDVNGGQYID
jgi:3-oxoacyl-[acyl-carrier protein] reductase